jgi:hypothetical protein
MSRFVRATLLPSLAALIAAITLPGLQRVVASLWALYVTACGLFLLRSYVASLVGRSRFEAVLQPDIPRTARPEDLERLERALGWRTYSPQDFDYEVRPLLRQLIVHNARSRRGVELIPDATAGTGVIDDELVAVAAGVPAEDLFGDAVRTRDLDRLLEKIESM